MRCAARLGWTSQRFSITHDLTYIVETSEDLEFGQTPSNIKFSERLILHKLQGSHLYHLTSARAWRHL